MSGTNCISCAALYLLCGFLPPFRCGAAFLPSGAAGWRHGGDVVTPAERPGPGQALFAAFIGRHDVVPVVGPPCLQSGPTAGGRATISAKRSISAPARTVVAG